jgi:EAL domain-containing protein (putative c-di-GMP-specific phosphodiesterase class I)
MSNHFHILLEVPPLPAEGISDDELLKRLGAIYTEAFVATVAKELKEARKTENQRLVDEIHGRFTYRMHDLSEFMKSLLQRLTLERKMIVQEVTEDTENEEMMQNPSFTRKVNELRPGLRRNPSNLCYLC